MLEGPLKLVVVVPGIPFGASEDITILALRLVGSGFWAGPSYLDPSRDTRVCVIDAVCGTGLRPRPSGSFSFVG